MDEESNFKVGQENKEIMIGTEGGEASASEKRIVAKRGRKNIIDQRLAVSLDVAKINLRSVRTENEERYALVTLSLSHS